MRIKVVHPPRGARRRARRRTLVPGRANKLVVLIAEYCCCASVSLGRGARYGDVRDQREHGPVVCARRCSTVSVVAVQFACGVARGTVRAGGHADGASQGGSTFVTRDRTQVHLGHGKGQKETSHTRKTNSRTAPAGARHKVRPLSTRREPCAVLAQAASTTFRARCAPPGTGPSSGRGDADLA